MSKLRYLLLLFAVTLLVSGFWLYQRPLPAVTAEVVIPQTKNSAPIKLPWPSYGQAAFGAVGYGVLDKNNSSKSVPIASIAKAITAMAILQKHPLQKGDKGPTITIKSSDVALFESYFAKDGSVLPVKVGEQLSQYQALQAMMLPSANNIADTTAVWAFGSLGEYLDYANGYVKSIGMTRTTVADASGFSPKTKSTAEDLVRLGEAVLANPVLAEIVNQKEASFPEVGLVHNVNWLLGVDGIIGIKTGNTDEAGGCYLFGAKRKIGGQQVTVVGAILGAPIRATAMGDSRGLIHAADRGFESAPVVKSGQVVGRYNFPWGGLAEVAVAGDLEALNWKGNATAPEVEITDLHAPLEQGSEVGVVRPAVGTKSVKLILKQPTTSPSLLWRIFR